MHQTTLSKDTEGMLESFHINSIMNYPQTTRYIPEFNNMQRPKVQESLKCKNGCNRNRFMSKELSKEVPGRKFFSGRSGGIVYRKFKNE